MARQAKMVALRPFPFNGEVLAPDEEFTPDNKEQGDLLVAIGLATRTQRRYLNRSIQPKNTAVMTTEA